jgi:hypothetical protein
LLDQRGLAGASLGGDGDDPPVARARLRERIAQASQLFFALEKLDGRVLGW